MVFAVPGLDSGNWSRRAYPGALYHCSSNWTAVTMPSRVTLLRMAATIIDHVIDEHSGVLALWKGLSEYEDLYKETYFKIEATAVNRLVDVLNCDREHEISLVYDLDPVLQTKLQRFAWNFYPKMPERLN